MNSSNVMVTQASWAAALSCWKGAVCRKCAVSSAAVSGRKRIPVISLYRGSTTGVWHSWEWRELNGESVFLNDDTIMSSFDSPVSWSIERIHAKNSENLLNLSNYIQNTASPFSQTWKIYFLYDFWCAQTCSFQAIFGLPMRNLTTAAVAI